MMDIKVPVCDHFSKDFREKLDDISIEENNNFDSVSNNTLTYWSGIVIAILTKMKNIVT